MPEHAPPTSSDNLSVAIGTVIGGRFEISRGAGEEHLARVWVARDQRSQKRIALRILRDEIMPPSNLPALRQECQKAAALKHRNIARVFGIGKTPTGGTFVAQEWVKGSPLSHFVASRESSGEPLSLRGAYNVIAHVCNAVGHAHDQGVVHGALRPDIVWVTKGGRVKVGDFGVSKTALRAVGPSAFSELGRASLAPEVKSGQTPDVRSDVFGIGAILYQLLTGHTPTDEFIPPSQAHPGATVAVDEILLRCLSKNPDDRYGHAQQIRSDLLPLLTEVNSTPPATDFGVAEEVDLRSVMPPAGLEIPVTPDRRKPGREDLTKKLEQLSDQSRAKWMVTKNSIDHGPFTARELVERIARGEFGKKDHALDIEEDDRRPLEKWTEFKPFLRQREREEVEQERGKARARAQVGERRSWLMKFVITFAIFGAIGLGVTGFLLTREKAKERNWEAEFQDLYKLGKIKLGEASLLPDIPRSGRKRRATIRSKPTATPKRRQGSSRGGFRSYEAAMNRAVDLGDVTQGGGSETRLSGNQVAGVVNGGLNKLYRQCVIPELKGGGKLGSVRIDIAIAGNGSVLGASVRNGSSSFRACLARAVGSIKFPKFGAPRMGASYRFSVE